MTSMVLEPSVHTPAARLYSSALPDPMVTDSKICDAMFNGNHNAGLLASLLVSALATTDRASVPVKFESNSTFGQVWAVNASTLFAIAPQALPFASISLTAEEQMVLRQAIWESVEVVAPGRFVEP